MLCLEFSQSCTAAERSTALCGIAAHFKLSDCGFCGGQKRERILPCAGDLLPSFEFIICGEVFHQPAIEHVFDRNILVRSRQGEDQGVAVFNRWARHFDTEDFLPSKRFIMS